MTELEWDIYVQKVAATITVPKADDIVKINGKFEWKTVASNNVQKTRKRNRSYKAVCKRVDDFFKDYENKLGGKK